MQFSWRIVGILAAVNACLAAAAIIVLGITVMFYGERWLALWAAIGQFVVFAALAIYADKLAARQIWPDSDLSPNPSESNALPES